MNFSDLYGSNFGLSQPVFSNAPISNIDEVLSRYHFMGITQTRSFYSEHSLNPSSLFQIEKIVRLNVPSNPEVKAYLRQLKLYFYLTDFRGNIIPLKGTIRMSRKITSDSDWLPVSISNIEWSFMENEDPNERYNRLLFSPIEIEPTQTNNGENMYEVRIQFEPDLPAGRSIKIFSKGSDKQQTQNMDIYHPAMSVYFTTCPVDPDYCHNLLLEVISTLIGIADKSGIYDDTEYNGAPTKVLAALPQLRMSSSKESQSNWKIIMDKLSEKSNPSTWAGQINMNEISSLRNENSRLRSQLGMIAGNK